MCITSQGIYVCASPLMLKQVVVYIFKYYLVRVNCVLFWARIVFFKKGGGFIFINFINLLYIFSCTFLIKLSPLEVGGQ